MKLDQLKREMQARGFDMHIDHREEPGEIDVYHQTLLDNAESWIQMMIFDETMYDVHESKDRILTVTIEKIDKKTDDYEILNERELLTSKFLKMYAKSPALSGVDKDNIRRAEDILKHLVLTPYEIHEIDRRAEYREIPKDSVQKCFLNASKWFQENGFQLEMTGGGCTAWTYTLDHGILLVTDDDGSDEPIYPDRLCYVGTYDNEGMDRGCQLMHFQTLMDIWN